MFSKVAPCASVVSVASVLVGLGFSAPVSGAEPATGVVAAAATVSAEPMKLGVATYNIHKRQPVVEAQADAQLLASQANINIIGWQELNRYPGIVDRLGGDWKSAHGVENGRELAVSWKTSEFRLVRVHTFRMHRSDAYYAGAQRRLVARAAKRFPSRTTLKVVLQHRASRQLVTVFNTHLNAHIEATRFYPGKWRDNANARMSQQHLRKLKRLWERAQGPWVIGVGDLNFGFVADAKRRVEGGPWRTFAGVATSSYQALGPTAKVTHPETGRLIDYVLVDDRVLNSGAASFVNHSALDGYHSDHRPLLARLQADFSLVDPTSN